VPVAKRKTTKTKAKTKSSPAARPAKKVKRAAGQTVKQATRKKTVKKVKAKTATKAKTKSTSSPAARPAKKVKRATGKTAKQTTKKKPVKKVKAKTASAKRKPVKTTKLRVPIATKPAASTQRKSPAPAIVEPLPTPAPPPPKPIPKTRLSDKYLREFEEMLLIKRAELAGDVVNLTEQALQSNEGGDGASSSMPIHMADLGSDNWEKEFTLGLIDNEKALVKEIDEALQRIKNRTYGVCIATRRPITLARLRAKPWAKYTIEYARKREEGRLP